MLLLHNVLFVAVNQRNCLKLTFGDADSQLYSPMSKRLRLVTDSLDCLADLREQQTKSSAISSSEDKTPRKFRLLFGGSSEELSQQLSPRDGDHGDEVDSAESDVTSGLQSEPSSDSDTSQSEYERLKDEDVMTQADEEAMKTYVPLNAGALSYISDDDENILDFFLKPPSSRLGSTNCRTVRRLHISTSDAGDVVTSGIDDIGNERAKSSSVLNKTSSVTDDQCNDTSNKFVALKMLVQEPSPGISELSGNDRHFTVTVAADKTTISNQDNISSKNDDNYVASKVAVCAAVDTEVGMTVAEDVQNTHQTAPRQAVCTAQSCSQGSDDFRTPASQNSTHGNVVVIDGDVTSRSAGSQPLDSDSTVDIGCSPVKHQLHTAAAAGTSPTHFASDATTTDGWCTPCKSSVPDGIHPQSPCHQLTNTQSCSSQLRTSVVSPPSACSKLISLSASTSQARVSDAQCVFFTSSVTNVDRGPRSPCLKFTNLRSSSALSQSSISAVNIPILQLCRDVSSSTPNDTATDRQVVIDSYDGDVDSDSDDVISLCVGVRRRRTVRQRLRSRSTSADPLVISSDSDQSPLPQRSRDLSKDGVGRVDVTTVSSGGESDDSVQVGCNETDGQHDFTSRTSATERSPVLFSESSM